MKSLQRGTLFEWLGPIVVGFAATCAFVLTQLHFFFGGQELLGVSIHATHKLDQPGFYVLTTFGSLVFLVASLYLPKVLKLKVGAIELEKSTVEQISAPVSLGTGR